MVRIFFIITMWFRSPYVLLFFMTADPHWQDNPFQKIKGKWPLPLCYVWIHLISHQGWVCDWKRVGNFIYRSRRLVTRQYKLYNIQRSIPHICMMGNLLLRSETEKVLWRLRLNHFSSKKFSRSTSVKMIFFQRFTIWLIKLES